MKAERVTLELDYADMVLVEWAISDFIDSARSRITKLQSAKLEEERLLRRIYANRIRAAKRVKDQVGASLDARYKLGGSNDEREIL